MKKSIVCMGVVVILLTAAIPAFSQIAKIQFAEKWPELCIWIEGIPFLQASNAEEVCVTYENGNKAYFYYEGTYLISKEFVDELGTVYSQRFFEYKNGRSVREYGYDDRFGDVEYHYQWNPNDMHVTDENGETVRIVYFNPDNGNIAKKETEYGWTYTYLYEGGKLISRLAKRGDEKEETFYYWTGTGLLEGISQAYGDGFTLYYNRKGEPLEVETWVCCTGSDFYDITLNERGHVAQIGPITVEWTYK